MDPAHKLVLVQVLTDLLNKSKLYPDSITLTDITPQRGRRGAGGAGDVYKATCSGEEVALKAFRLPLPSSATTLTSLESFDNRAGSFLSELVIWQRLSHPNVLPFYGVHFLDMTVETRFCLVSPWMENGNVVEFLERKDSDTDATDCVSLVRWFRNLLFHSLRSLYVGAWYRTWRWISPWWENHSQGFKGGELGSC